MNGIILKSMQAVVLTAGLVSLAGCYRDVVDTCYPERYNFVAHNTVCSALKAQVNNGHVLEQTLWNWHFEMGKATLNDAGQEQIQALLRRRPQPDTVIYLQTAQVGPVGIQDIQYDPAAPEKTSAARRALDDGRIASVKAFIKGIGASDLNIQIMDPHDPTQINIPAVQGGLTITQWNAAPKGVLAGSSGGGGAGAAGGAGGGR